MYDVLVQLLRPHPILALLAAWALYRLWRRRHDPNRSLLPLTAALAALALLSLPAVGYLAILSLEGPYPPADETPEGAEAIVVFSAGMYHPEGRRGRAEMDEDTLHRCLHAARLYAQAPRPVVVSGGKVDPDKPGPSAAAVMGELLRQLGVKPAALVLEERSRNTYENAVECARLLQDKGLGRVVLVTDAVDVRRAAACLRKQGVEVVPSPCHYRAVRFPLSAYGFVPSASGAAGVGRAWHEWVGTLWYWLRGRL